MKLPDLSKLFDLPELHKALPEWQRQIHSADKKNRKTDADVEIAGNQRLIMTGDDGLKYTLTIVGGVITPTPV